MVRAAGMHITATNILGLPTSTLEDDLDTMRLNAQARISYAYAFLFQPYPGTELGQFAQDNDLMVGTFDDIGEVAWDHSILVFEDEDDKRQREHLQRLFAIGVEWPWLEPVIRRLIKLPHNRFVDGSFLVGAQAAQRLCHLLPRASREGRAAGAVEDRGALHEDQELANCALRSA